MPKRKPGLQSAEDINTRFGARLRETREVAGRSQSDVGDALGVSFQQIQKYENGTTSISLSRMESISHYLRVPIVRLLDTIQTEPDALVTGFAEDGQATYGDPREQLFGSGPLSKQKIALLNAYDRITEAQVRKNLLALAEAIALASPD